MIENQTSNKPKPEPRLDYKGTLRRLYAIGPYFLREHYAKVKRIAGNIAIRYVIKPIVRLFLSHSYHGLHL